jgi:hypothetical protein
MSRREQIGMSESEVAAFLAQERTVTCATIGTRGWPHLMLETLPGDVSGMVAKQASKRIGLELAERRRSTWDHRKLQGVY